MKALILAAGVGSRLAPLTDRLPKSLIEVNGTPILMHQIECLHLCGITDITVVAGYLAPTLVAAVRGKYPEISVIESTEYAVTNNMYSAWLAREAMAGHDFIMMNADVFFDASVLRALLDCPHPNAVCVDVGRYMEESMKVTERSGRLTAIAKTISPEEALGTSTDVYKLSPEAGDAFFARCGEYIEGRGDRRRWSEAALNDIFPSVDFYACAVEGRWMEIDNGEDLAAARMLFDEKREK